LQIAETSGSIWITIFLFVAITIVPLALFELALSIDVPAQTLIHLFSCRHNDGKILSVAQCVVECPSAFTNKPLSFSESSIPQIAVDILSSERDFRSWMKVACILLEAIAALTCVVPLILSLTRSRRCLRLLPFGIQIWQDVRDHNIFIAKWFVPGFASLLTASVIKIIARYVTVGALSVSTSQFCAHLQPLVGDAAILHQRSASQISALPIISLHTLNFTACVCLLTCLTYGLLLWSVYSRSTDIYFDMPLSRLNPLALEKLGIRIRYRISLDELNEHMLRIAKSKFELTLKSFDYNRRLNSLIDQIDSEIKHDQESSSGSDIETFGNDRSSLLRKRQRYAKKAVANMLNSFTSTPMNFIRKPLNWLKFRFSKLSAWHRWTTSTSFWQLDCDELIVGELIKALFMEFK
jgi:hypothetical protein